MRSCLFLAFAIAVALSGCTLVNQPPSAAKARRYEADRRASERAAHVAAEARRLEQQGLRNLEAQALARAQARGGWP